MTQTGSALTNRRRFQFSLTALLLTVCVVAVLFGFLLPLANWALIVEAEWHETAMRMEIPQSEAHGDLKSIAFLLSATAMMFGSIAAVRRFNAGRDG